MYSYIFKQYCIIYKKQLDDIGYVLYTYLIFKYKYLFDIVTKSKTCSNIISNMCIIFMIVFIISKIIIIKDDIEAYRIYRAKQCLDADSYFVMFLKVIKNYFQGVNYEAETCIELY